MAFRIPHLVFAACLIVAATPVRTQEPASPASEPRPRTPEQLLDKSVRDLSQGNLGKALKDDVTALRRGPLLMHGNFCGIGARPGKLPVDALDEACMRHDACTKTGALPSCACDDRLRLEATAIAKDPATKPEIKTVALATASAMALLICKVAPPTP